MNKSSAFASLRSLIWHNKKLFFFTDLMRIASCIPISFLPYYLGRLATSSGDHKTILRFIILIIVSNAIHWALWHLGDFIVAIKINPLFYEYKKIAFNIFWDKEYTTFIDKPSGKVGYYINQFKSEIYTLYDAYHYGFLPMMTAIPIYVFLIYRAAWQNSIIYVFFLILSGVVLIKLTKPMNKAQRIYTDGDSSNSGRVFDSYANFVNVFAFRAHRKEVSRNNTQIDSVIKKDISASIRVMTYWATASTLARMILWPIIIVYSWFLYNNGAITFTSFVICITVLVDFTNQYWNVVHQLGMWNKNASTFRESYEYLFPDQNIIKEFYLSPRSYEDTTALSLTSSLEIRNLNFSYPDAKDNPVLKNINLTIHKNEKIGIVGKSGSGKSTLTKILLGFYKDFEGEILVDGIHVDTDDLSQLYTYVPQDTTLFQESLSYNIAYAASRVPSEQEIIDAAKNAHINKFIDSLPEGYDTLVGERGVKLSLGQRQRVAIARAFLKQADLLILDEATSSLDSKTESYVQESFEKLWRNKAVIAIAHRLSTLNNVDRIIVMSNGEIVEQGTKEELLALGGYFADLWHHQKKGMI